MWWMFEGHFSLHVVLCMWQRKESWGINVNQIHSMHFFRAGRWQVHVAAAGQRLLLTDCLLHTNLFHPHAGGICSWVSAGVQAVEDQQHTNFTTPQMVRPLIVRFKWHTCTPLHTHPHLHTHANTYTYAICTYHGCTTWLNKAHLHYAVIILICVSCTCVINK